MPSTRTGDADELHLYANNESDLYRSYRIPTWRTLIRMKRQGTYTRNAAIALFRPMVDVAADRWNHEFRDPESRRRFPLEARREAAEEFAKNFEVEYDLGNLDGLVTTTGHADEPPLAMVTAGRIATPVLEQDIRRLSGVATHRARRTQGGTRRASRSSR